MFPNSNLTDSLAPHHFSRAHLQRFLVDQRLEWFEGEVTSYDEESGFYRIVYEDEDLEDLSLEELLPVLVSGKDEKAKDDSMDIPSSSDDEDAYSEDSSDSDDSFRMEVYNDDLDHQHIQTPAKKGSSTSTTTRTKRAATMVTPSPPKSKGTVPSNDTFEEPKNVINPRSVALCGLPRGALAKCRKTGLSIRSIDGILPISRSSSFLHSTANPERKTTKNAASSATTTPTSDTPLPGRILIASLDQNRQCPSHFLGRTFSSVAEFHASLPRTVSRSLAIDYGMEVIADPVFSPWDFVHARLDSSGLLETYTDEAEGPLLFVVRVQWDGKSRVSGIVSWYEAYVSEVKQKDREGLQWAIIEATQTDHPSVLVGAPLSLLEHSENKFSDNDCINTERTKEIECTNDDDINNGCDEDLLPLPATKVVQVHLPASLLQKAIRRGTGLCSTVPLLEACNTLLNSESSPPGSTLAMLKTLWECMLVDASPFDDADDCLGLPSLLLLSLIAKANPEWTMPATLRHAAVVSAIRTAKAAPSQPWLGFSDRFDYWWELEECAEATAATRDQKALNLRNILRAAQAVVGGRLAWGKWNMFVGDASAAAVLSYLNNDEWNGSYLPAAPSPLVEESMALPASESTSKVSFRFNNLDTECRLSAVEPSIMPSTLVLLQSLLSRPPTKWQKHSLPALSRQVRKLMSEANARHKERVQLARLSTWGKDKTRSTSMASATAKVTTPAATYESFREVVTPSGLLSEQESEVVNCFEAIQKWMVSRLRQEPNGDDQQTLMNDEMIPTQIKSTNNVEMRTHYRQVKVGAPLSPFEGRVGFLLAFATSVEVEVCPDPKSRSSKEVVSAMFCGDTKEPLLVQRIGKARREGREAATAGGTASGATAVPSLGYVHKERSREEAMLFEAAEKAMADHWDGGKILPLPVPPAGVQWDLPLETESMNLDWEEKEFAVARTAELVESASGKKEWRFTIAGKPVDAFDARPVMSPCALDTNDGCNRLVTLEPGSDRDHLLRIALYVEDDAAVVGLPHGKTVLRAMARLHFLAKTDRETSQQGLSEGRVYDWMPLANASLLPSRTWRDALLAIRTREKNHVVLGKGIRSDGSGTPLDLAEGVLVRLFHGLEFLYPQTIRKDSALKFRVRPRGAAYYHLLTSLERLGRGEGSLGYPSKSVAGRKKTVQKTTNGTEGKRKRQESRNNSKKNKTEPVRLNKRPKRNAALSAGIAISLLKEEPFISKQTSSKDDNFTSCESDSDDSLSLDGSEEHDEHEFLPIPRIKTTLWTHQEASVAKVVEGVVAGKRGHADASAVGAGKTLTALATIVRLAQWIEDSGRSRHGVLVLLPTKALIREWLIEIATHTEGFHLIEQREDGSLFSLTYGKTHPPIDGNALVISTLDRVCKHPFVRQAAWDFVVIDECLSVQNAAAKRTPSAWRQIEVSMCGVLMLSATFFRSKYDQLFYMIRMLRSPLPRTIEWLPATIHENVVCQIPETDRTWQMRGEMVPLAPNDLRQYRGIIDTFRRQQINEPSNVDGRRLWVNLESFLRSKYEGRTTRTTYRQTSVMADAFVKVSKGLLIKGYRPLIFADTSQEADFLLRALSKKGLDASTWASIASKQVSGTSASDGRSNKTVIVAVKTVEGQGINMQKYADAIVCRPVSHMGNCICL